ncbi:hypothetical protein KEJ18_01900 [Candidatus Bathyarchaeota archaeon]|nr:hypothetical protein [Candidatus Bathyarchaeota archaeon]
MVEACWKHPAKDHCNVEKLAWGDDNSWADLDNNGNMGAGETLRPCVLVSISFFEGEVVAAGDEGFLSNVLIDEADNYKLWKNIINWLVKDEKIVTEFFLIPLTAR